MRSWSRSKDWQVSSDLMQTCKNPTCALTASPLYPRGQGILQLAL
jgi:hypothetical protein